MNASSGFKTCLHRFAVVLTLTWPVFAAGPALVVELDIEALEAELTLSGTTDLGRLRGPLDLELSVNGQSLGRRRIQDRNEFSIQWHVVGFPPGRHQFRIAASSFMVPHDYFGNQDFRPLSYRVTRLEVVKTGEVIVPVHVR